MNRYPLCENKIKKLPPLWDEVIAVPPNLQKPAHGLLSVTSRPILHQPLLSGSLSLLSGLSPAVLSLDTS